MKVVVLGSGVIGVTTAYYLARAGAEVTVIDRQDGPALDTSFANAGQVSFGYSTPWGAPGIPMKALKWMFEKHAPLSIRPDGSLFQLRWMAQMLRNCSTERYAVNKERMLRLSNYSRQCIAQLRADTGIEYEGRQAGTLQLFRSQKQVDQAQRDIAVLQECGIDYELLDPQGVARAEPALARADATIAGGLLLPADETGDCFKFTNQLAQMAEALGVKFRFGTAVDWLLFDGQGAVNGVQLSGPQREVVKADRYVLARMVDAPGFAPPATWEVVRARGPFRLPDELELLTSRAIDVLVTKDSGGGTDAKLDAAATLGVPVVAVRRPPPPEGIGVVSSVDEAVAWIVRRPGAATP